MSLAVTAIVTGNSDAGKAAFLLNPVGSAGTVAAASTTVAPIYYGEQSLKQQEEANRRAEQLARDQAKKAEEQFNRANQKKPDLSGLFAANEAMAKGGIGGTLLTGPQGVEQNKLLLGRSTLLGS